MEQNYVSSYKGVLPQTVKDNYGLKPLGKQWSIELYGCDPQTIDTIAHVQEIMIDAVKAAKANIVAHKFHKFAPQGVSGAVIIAESHLAIHTWPEYQYCAIDLFTCGDHTNHAAALHVLKKGFKATGEYVSTELKRGVKTNGQPYHAYAQKGLTKDTWGMLSSLDIGPCDPATIRSIEKIKEYVAQLCCLIKMKRFGECQVVNFGDDERIAGYSMVQLIETSCISGHFANATNRAYIDIFSCKFYDPDQAAEFTKDFFGADNYSLNVILRK